MKSIGMIKMLMATVALAPAIMSVSAQEPVLQRVTTTDTVALGVGVNDIKMGRNGDMMSVKMDIDLAGTRMHGDRAIVYTPVIVNGGDSLRLTSVGLYSHVRWIQYQRDGEKPMGGSSEVSYRYSQRPGTYTYEDYVPYADWMSNSTLVLKREDYGCCHRLLDEGAVNLAKWREIMFAPTLKYIRPTAAREKTREIEGEAFIDFPVDQTVIYHDFRNNAFELDSIVRTIDVVRNDPDATIRTVWLKGFASPESPYKHNTDLAKGRTAALKNYIQKLYNFTGVEILTDYEPEDWAGLRKAVEKSNLDHRNEILAMIDMDMDPDVKEAKIKSSYPDDYRFMLRNFYPPLRHTNYKISYVVRSYNDPEEILQIMRTRPRNLDLDEFYIAASVLEPGSDEFNEVFETAVRMYPHDETANLNAANAAIYRKDFVSAERYLGRAGNSGEAIYARSILSAYQGDYASAKTQLEAALRAGIVVDDAELQTLMELIELNESR
ncbi:MAG: hypothetical protein J1E84_02085 [Muribaculaceae bacterium]|nr:hypothetical protein [Muribaculaceae bacterium]